ncbi:hypothetical protein BU16DRAFT_523506 [Lophium mytilinum]|uniref:Uncharacterized protein n=1 Tax=Lophium mytilinum TaxID=390894 RepID=A0A6A6RAG4_9PEZI|nr:hypothetical protein BU16DRAFT_523506 [Lophium mytilinum]
MVELMMGQVEEERALADGRPERGMVEQMSMLSPPLESLAEEDEDEGQDGTSMVSPLLESLILETAEQNATEDEVVKGVMVVEREVEDVEEEGEVPNKIREDAKEEGSRLCNNALPHP